MALRNWWLAHRLQLALAAITSTLAVVLVGEVGLRVLSQTDEDGNVYVLGRHVRPFALPIKRVAAAIDVYLKAPTSVLMADSETGWSPRPNSQNELYAYNASGIRVARPDVEHDTERPAGTVRMSIFGDSFTNGVDEAFDGTWGRLLEKALDAGGRDHELLNFGVPAFGMDQALLRWRQVGRAYATDIVVFGLQIENIRRNTNLIRPLYNPYVDIPFSKPRFVLRGDNLELVNRPTVAPESLARTVENINEWHWAAYEDYFDPADYEVRTWHRSHLLRVVAHVISDRQSGDDLIATAEQRTLALRLLEDFRSGVESTGARFIVVHLPQRTELQALADTGSLPAASFLAEVNRRFAYVETAPAMLDAASQRTLSDLFNASDHYTAVANLVVARCLAETLRAHSKDVPKAD